MSGSRKVLLVVADYKGERQEMFEHHFSPRNRAYCAFHGFDYVVSKGSDFRHAKSWCKLQLIDEMLRHNELADGDTVAVMDADSCLVNGNLPFQTPRTFSYAIDNAGSHSLGFFILNVNAWGRLLLDHLLDEDLFQRHSHELKWKHWWEQAAWYALAGIKYFNPFSEPDYGFLSAPTADTCFSIEELRQHVEIRDPRWNTLLLPDELNDVSTLNLRRHFKLVSRKKDTIIRHFGGGQRWRIEYAFKPVFPSPENADVSLHPDYEPPRPSFEKGKATTLSTENEAGD